MSGLNEVTRQPGDDHMHIIVGQHIKLCQQTMSVDIANANNKAQKAHERLDKHVDLTHNGENGLVARMARLDDAETGKVTIMWKAYKTVILYLVLAGLISFGASYLGASSRATVDVKTLVKAAVKQAINESVKSPEN